MAPWTLVCQAPLPTEFSRQGYWSGLPFLPPGDLPTPGIEPMSPASPTLAGGAPYLLILNPELIYLHLN